MIIKAPSLPTGSRRDQLVGLQDILPTLTALTGCPLEQEVHGCDLSPVLNDKSIKTRDLYYSQCMDHPQQSAMIFDGQWKYCYAQQGATEELYNLSEDPDELVNLALSKDAESLLQPWRVRLMDEAGRIGDSELLDGDKLVTSPLDRSEIAKLPVTGMGWRWY